MWQEIPNFGELHEKEPNVAAIGSQRNWMSVCICSAFILEERQWNSDNQPVTKLGASVLEDRAATRFKTSLCSPWVRFFKIWWLLRSEQMTHHFHSVSIQWAGLYTLKPNIINGNYSHLQIVLFKQINRSRRDFLASSSLISSCF